MICVWYLAALPKIQRICNDVKNVNAVPGISSDIHIAFGMYNDWFVLYK